MFLLFSNMDLPDVRKEENKQRSHCMYECGLFYAMYIIPHSLDQMLITKKFCFYLPTTPQMTIIKKHHVCWTLFPFCFREKKNYSFSDVGNISCELRVPSLKSWHCS